MADTVSDSSWQRTASIGGACSEVESLDAVLTGVETRILIAMSRGATGQRLAREVGLSRRTTERRVRELKAKLAARNAIHAVVIALRSGAIP